MSRRLLVTVLALSVLAGACSNLGLGEADCTPPERDVSSANFISFQAVPTAKYLPCLNELRLGWSSVAWFAEDGRAGIEIRGGVEAFETINPFLTATVTAIRAGRRRKCQASPIFSGSRRSPSDHSAWA